MNTDVKLLNNMLPHYTEQYKRKYIKIELVDPRNSGGLTLKKKKKDICYPNRVRHIITSKDTDKAHLQIKRTYMRTTEKN